MRYLYHDWMSPDSRLIRLVMAEKKLSFSLHTEPYWQARPGFLRFSPEGTIPVLVEILVKSPNLVPGTPDFEQSLFALSQVADLSDTLSLPTDKIGYAVTSCQAILDYLLTQYPENSLLSDNVLIRMEIQRLLTYCQVNFYRDCVLPLIQEKIVKRYYQPAATDSISLRTAKQNIPIYITYLNKLVQKRYWLAGEKPTIADFAAGAGISCLDYLAEITWSDVKDLRSWYRRLKSRPTFHPLLIDYIHTLSPPTWYTDLDF